MASEDWDFRSSSGGRGGRLSALSWYARRGKSPGGIERGRGRVMHGDWYTRRGLKGNIMGFGGEREVNGRVSEGRARFKSQPGGCILLGATHGARSSRRPFRKTTSARFISDYSS